MTQPTRVLIADDSAHAREGLRALLATWPEITVVGEARNGQEAVQQVSACRPDAVVMDLHMPVLDGAEATRLIKQLHPGVTVIVLTLYSTERNIALASGADVFLVKGADPERLLSALGVAVTSDSS